MTIAAIATAPGPGGIAIIRISGPDAERILREAFSLPFSKGGAPQGRRDSAPLPQSTSGRSDFPDHQMRYGHVLDAGGEPLDEVMAVLMRAPATYTREDVAEIHCHGGSVSARRVLARVIELGARPAAPGEFTRRAFLNGRIDLAEAEAVMQLIGANSEAAARASVRQLAGGVSAFVGGIADRLTALMALIEASADFPEEVEEDAAAEEVLQTLRAIIADIEKNCDPRGARILREGASVVLAGRPNVGKSSIMNALLGLDRAIVTDIPGTTRDVLTERVTLGGVLCELSDTAGQRETADPIEKIGVDRAASAVQRADVVLMVVDAAAPLSEEDRAFLQTADGRCIVCLNKTDLSPATTPAHIAALTDAKLIELSARTGSGMDELVGEIARRVSPDDARETRLVAQRHIDLATRAAGALRRAAAAIQSGFPLDTAAIDLREALQCLSDITGESAAESVIDRIFADFCVGK